MGQPASQSRGGRPKPSCAAPAREPGPCLCLPLFEKLPAFSPGRPAACSRWGPPGVGGRGAGQAQDPAPSLRGLAGASHACRRAGADLLPARGARGGGCLPGSPAWDPRCGFATAGGGRQQLPSPALRRGSACQSRRPGRVPSPGRACSRSPPAGEPGGASGVPGEPPAVEPWGELGPRRAGRGAGPQACLMGGCSPSPAFAAGASHACRRRQGAGVFRRCAAPGQACFIARAGGACSREPPAVSPGPSCLLSGSLHSRRGVLGPLPASQSRGRGAGACPGLVAGGAHARLLDSCAPGPPA